MTELRALTSLRGLAALYVALLHFSTAIERHCAVQIPALAPRGHLAVDFFFVLSGFIMAYTYSREFAERGILNTMPSFMIKRMARLMPLHFFVTACLLLYTLAVAPGFHNPELPAFSSDRPVLDVVLNFLLLQGLGLAPNMNGPSWSISVEMFAYLAFPLFLLLLFHRSASMRWIATGIAVLCLILTASQKPQLSLDTISLPVGWTIARGFAEFALGMVAFRAYALGGRADFYGSDRFVLAFGAIAASMMLLRLWDLVAVLAFPAIILGIAHNRGAVARLLEHPWLYFLGVISFSLYLLHYPIAYLELNLLRAMHPEPLGRTAALSLALAGALSTIPVAWVVYRWVEHPGRSMIRAIGERVSAGAATRTANRKAARSIR